MMADRAKKLKFSFDDHDQPLDTLFPSKSLLGSMVSFGGVGGVKGSSNSLYHFLDPQENGDDYFNQPEKKKRLSVDQVQFLETCFKNENKLEPERKVEVAHELGLQPRQIAVWFQNRKARSKTKQLETEYETLQASYTSLKADYDYLIKENQKLKNQVFHLKHDGIMEDSEMAKNCDLREAVACNKVEEQSDVSSARLSDDSCRVFEADEELLECGYNVFPQIEDAYCHPLSSSCGYEYDSFWSY